MGISLLELLICRLAMLPSCKSFILWVSLPDVPKGRIELGLCNSWDSGAGPPRERTPQRLWLTHLFPFSQDALRNSGGDGLGQMSLEFYQKKKSRWPFSDECIPWEVWTVKVHVVALATEQERQICREKVGEKLCEKIINIVEVMNRHEYLPKMPTQSEVDNVFDTGLRDVQPYLYKISFQITDALGTSVTTTMRRLIKDTLAL